MPCLNQGRAGVERAGPREGIGCKRWNVPSVACAVPSGIATCEIRCSVATSVTAPQDRLPEPYPADEQRQYMRLVRRGQLTSRQHRRNCGVGAERAELGRKTRKRRSGGEEQPPREERTPAGESLSFESLTRDLDEAPYRASEGAPEPGPSRVLYEGAPLVDEEALNRRVLTGSASTRTPPWISGLCVSALAWVVLFSAWGASEIGGQRTILSLVALVLSLGTVIWTGPGAFSKAAIPARRWIRVAFGLGLVALLLSGLGAWGAMS